MPHRQDRNDGANITVQKLFTVSMPHRQDRNVEVYNATPETYVFPCLIGRIGIIQQSHQGQLGTSVSMPHRQDRNAALLAGGGLELACFHASQVGSEYCFLAISPDIPPVSMPHRQDRNRPLPIAAPAPKVFPCLIGRIGIRGNHEERLERYVMFPCLIGRIGMGKEITYITTSLSFHASQVGSEYTTG